MPQRSPAQSVPALRPLPRNNRTESYLESLQILERLHRLMLDLVKDEFERLNILEINSVQALLLFNIGENEVTAGELKTKPTQHSVKIGRAHV